MQPAAWATRALGASARPLTVRDALVAEMSLPRFLAPSAVARADASLLASAGVGALDAPTRFTPAPSTV